MKKTLTIEVIEFGEKIDGERKKLYVSEGEDGWLALIFEDCLGEKGKWLELDNEERKKLKKYLRNKNKE